MARPPDSNRFGVEVDRVAGHAVDLVAAQLNANKTGAPDLPRMMQSPGRWIAPRNPTKPSVSA